MTDSSRPESPPAYFALFCTTDVPVECLKKLIEQPSSIDEDAQDIWVLIRSHSQTSFTHGITSQLPTSTSIKTDFPSPTHDSLGAFCRASFADLYTHDDEKRIAEDMFGVIDERTLEDSTLQIVQWDLVMKAEEDIEGDENDDDAAFEERWVSVRVKLSDAADWLRSLTHKSVEGARVESAEDGVLPSI